MALSRPIGDPRSTAHPTLPRMISIPEGWFAMGCGVGQDVEQPVHRVWVDMFELSATQVTNAEYDLFLRDTGRQPPPYWNKPGFSRPDHPVVAVSWFEATAYCEWLTSETRTIYRLPTEAEWERAARGEVEQQLYPWGNEPPQSRPKYSECWLQGPEPVRQSAPNGFGLYEMCENVHEWCTDWFQADYYSVSPERNPRGPETGQRKSSRGGSWRHHIKISRCSARSSIPPEFQYADYGFRLTRSIPAK